MATADYGVGSISLQVLPSFVKFRQEFAKEMRQLRNSLSEGLKEESAKSGVESGKLFRSNFQRGIKDMKADVDFGNVEREATATAATVRAALDGAVSGLSGEAAKEFAEIKAQAETILGNIDANVDVDTAGARLQLEELVARMDAVAAKEPSIKVDLDAMAARSQLAAFAQQVDRVERDDVQISVNLRGEKAATMGLLGVGAAGHAASGGVRSLGASLLFAAAAVPVLATGMVGLVGLLGAIAPAAMVAGAAIAAIGLAGSGVGGAIAAMKAKQGLGPTVKLQKAKHREESSGIRLARAEHDAAARVADAKQSASRASASAAKREAEAVQSLNKLTAEGGEVAQRVSAAKDRAASANTAALKREEAAQKKVRDAVENVGKAEDRLRKAREGQKDKGKDIAHDIRANKLAEDSGVLQLFDATTAYNSTMSDGSASTKDKEQARISLESAKLSLEDTRAEGQRLAAEQANWNKTGVEGTDEVKTAKESVVSAVEAQRDAESTAADAAREKVATQVEGERLVAQAIADGQSRILDAEQKATDAHADAVQTRADGEQKVADAVEAGKRAVDDARDSLAQAADAADIAGAGISSAFDQQASPAVQRFAAFVMGLSGPFNRLREDVAAVLLPPVQDGLMAFLSGPGGKAARDALVAIAAATGKVVGALAVSFNSDAWVGFFDKLAEVGPSITANFGEALISFMQGLASVLTALLPSTEAFSEDLADMMARFAEWAASPEGQQQIKDFMDHAKEVGKDAADALGKVASTVWAVCNAISNADPDLIKALAAGLLAIAAGMTAVWVAANWPVLAVALVVGALTYLYLKCDWFRAGVDFMGKVIWAGLKWLLDETILIFGYIAQGALWLWGKMKEAGSAIADGWHWLGRKAGQLKDDVLGSFSKLGTGISDFAHRVFEPVVAFLKDKALPALKSAFQSTVEGIGTIWSGLQKLVGKPIKFVIETIINKGLIAGFNDLSGKVGGPKIGDVPIPKWMAGYATGGVLPGHTPGRDVHRFVSPTGGTLNLSGGEAIMRPEWTAAVGGPAAVEAMNAAARRSGIKGVRAFLGGNEAFARGGVVGGGGTWTPRFASEVLSAAEKLGVVINVAQRGFRPATSYSGTSHRGDAIDAMGPGNLWSLRDAFRANGIAAWVRGPAQGFSWHVHGVPMGPAFGQGAGSAVYQAQDYRAGGAGLRGSGQPDPYAGHGSQTGPAGFGGELSTQEVPSGIKEFLKNPLSSVKGWASKKLDAFREKFGSGSISKAIAAVPNYAMSAIKSKAEGMIPQWMKDIANGVADTAHNVASTVRDQVDIGLPSAGNATKNAVAAAIGKYAHEWLNDKTQWGSLSKIIDHESSWDPTSKNPSSTARGLFQLLYEPGTRKPYGVHDVDTQVKDGVGYIKGRYGNPESAWAFWQMKRWYKDGGVLPGDLSTPATGQPYNGTVLRDNGGPLRPGMTSVLNLTGETEHVYTARQHAMAQAAMSAQGGRTGGGDISVSVSTPNLPAGEVADQVASEVAWTMRKIQREGRYSLG